MKLGAFLFGAALTCAAGGMAHAGTITYELTGSGDGTLNGNPYSGQFDIVATGQTGGVYSVTSPINASVNGYNPFGGASSALDVTITLIGVGTATVTDPSYVFYAIPFEIAGFGASPNGDFLDFQSSHLSGYDLASSIGPLAVDQEHLGSVNTNYGSLEFDDVSGLQFTVVAAPEPATWIMMLTGFGGICAAAGMARRKDPVPVAQT